MLILTRSITQTITIGDDISVSILGVKGNQVRIGIDAPKEVSVHRSEIYDRILNEHRTAAPKSDLYDTLVAKQASVDNEKSSATAKASSTAAKTTTITVKKRRKVVI